jgi:iron-hydrogenase subunit alpha
VVNDIIVSEATIKKVKEVALNELRRTKGDSSVSKSNV